MNKFFIILALICSVIIVNIVWFDDKVINPSELQNRNGVFYAVNAESPFTGKIVKRYEDGGKQVEINYKDGKVEGSHIKWYDNGEKQGEANYENNRREGLTTLWYKNGQKSHEGNYKNGKKDGVFIKWFENGEKKSKERHKY